MPAFERIMGILELMRPMEWVKSFGNMVLGACLALLVMYNGNALQYFDVVKFLIAFIAVGPLLWGGLYMLNDWTDRGRDKKHPVKCNRPIACGKVSANLAIIISFLLIVSAIVIGYYVGKYFLVCIAAMLINQLLYTIDPISLKKRPVLDLISGSLINPFFRFYAGWTIFTATFSANILMVLFVVGFQFGGYTLYRLSSKAHEKELGYKSSIVVFPEKWIKGISYFAMAVAGIAFIAMPLLGVLPLRFLLLALLSLIFFPAYSKALTDPQKMDMKKMYNTIYVHYFVFVIGFIVLFAINF